MYSGINPSAHAVGFFGVGGYEGTGGCCHVNPDLNQVQMSKLPLPDLKQMKRELRIDYGTTRRYLLRIRHRQDEEMGVSFSVRISTTRSLRWLRLSN